jgi:hypothetical protein
LVVALRAARRWTVLLAVLLLAACGESPDDPVSGGSRPFPAPTQSVLEVEPREGLVDVRPHIFDSAEPVAPKRVRVQFYGGVEECEGLDRVEVREADEAVTITLFTGRLPEAEVCIEIAVLKATTIKLGSPLGEREIIDGAESAT